MAIAPTFYDPLTNTYLDPIERVKSILEVYPDLKFALSEGDHGSLDGTDSVRRLYRLANGRRPFHEICSLSSAEEQEIATIIERHNNREEYARIEAPRRTFRDDLRDFNLAYQQKSA